MGAFNFNSKKPRSFRFFFFFRNSFLLHADFYEYRLVAFGIDDNFFSHQTKRNSPIKKELQDVISTERDEKWQNSLSPSNSYIYESQFVDISAVPYMYFCVPILDSCALKLAREAKCRVQSSLQVENYIMLLAPVSYFSFKFQSILATLCAPWK